MRLIGTLPDRDQAQRFEDYLLTEGIRTQVDPENGEWVVWIIEEDDLEAAKTELDAFRANPHDEKYRDRSGRALKMRIEEQKANDEFRRNQVDVRTRWRGRGAGMGVRTGRMTIALIVISIAVTVYTNLGADLEKTTKLTFSGFAYSPTAGGTVATGLHDIGRGQIWRIFTPMFLHFDGLHILFNMMMLRVLGSAIEFRKGPGVYLALVFALSAAANFGQYWWDDLLRDRHSLFGGMSGVNYGLFGYLWMKSHFQPEDGFRVPQSMIMLLLAWFFLCLFGIIGSVANGAHAVGLVAGCLIGYWPTLMRNVR